MRPLRLLSGVLGSLLGGRRRPSRSKANAKARAPTPVEDLLVTVLVIVVVLLLLATFLYWVTGQVAGRVFGGAWPDVAFSDMPGVLLELLGSLDDPAAAWPQPARALLPGPVGFYVVMGALCLLPAAALVGGLHLVLRQGERSRSAAARPVSRRPRRRRAFASRRALRPLTVPAPQPGRVTLGRAGGRLLAAETGQSVAVLGPPRSLKTTGLALPAVLEWTGPVVVASTTTQLVLDSLERRQELGTVRLYDPTGTLTGIDVPRVAWSPLRHAATWSAAQRTARSLAAAAAAAEPSAPTSPGSPGTPAAEVPMGGVTDLLSAALLAAARARRTVADALAWLEDQEQEGVERILDASGIRVATVAFDDLWRLEETQRARIYAHAARILAPWADGEARQSGADVEQLDPAWLLDGGRHTLYLAAPGDQAQQLRPLVAAVLQEVVAAAQQRATRNGVTARLADGLPAGSPALNGVPDGAGQPAGLLLVLDDAADVGALRTLDLHASNASLGIQVVSLFRSLAAVRARYGDRAHALVNAHRARVVLSGTTDPETLDYVANLLGDANIRAGGPANGERRVTPAGLLHESQPGVGLLLYGSLPPVELTLRPWFRERRVRALLGANRLAAYGRSRPRLSARGEAMRSERASGR